MPRSENIPLSIVDPDKMDDRAVYRDAYRTFDQWLVDGGYTAADAKWLVELICRVYPPTEPDSVVDTIAKSAGYSRGYNEDRDTGLFLILAVLTGCVWNSQPDPSGNNPDQCKYQWPPSDSHAADIVEVMHQNGADFNRVLRNGWPKALIEDWQRTTTSGIDSRAVYLMRLLFQTHAIDITKVVDCDQMRQFRSTQNVRDTTTSVDLYDPRQIQSWIAHIGWKPLVALASLLSSEPDKSIIPFIDAVAQAALSSVVFSMQGQSRKRYDPLEPPRERFDEPIPNCVPELPEFALAMQPYFNELDRRVVQPVLNPHRSIYNLRPTWMRFFRMTWDSRPDECPPDVRKRVLEAATEYVARMRSIIGKSRLPDESSEEEQYCHHEAPFLSGWAEFRHCCMLLAHHGGLWHSMKPLLLALRSLRTPALAPDLRYWYEVGRDPVPDSWSRIPKLMSTLIHEYAGREQRRDPELKELREGMAQYLLKRLTDRWTKEQREAAKTTNQLRTNNDMVELDPNWRYCMIRAIMDLKVNPEGRGHRALYWSSKHDPDPTVRKAASSAYQSIRHERGLAAGASPRRAVMSALWWLKQAHLLGLGIQPDADGAQRTRAKELTRTKEVERNDNPASI